LAICHYFDPKTALISMGAVFCSGGFHIRPFFGGVWKAPYVERRFRSQKMFNTQRMSRPIYFLSVLWYNLTVE